jgi:cell division protease FtsH
VFGRLQASYRRNPLRFLAWSAVLAAFFFYSALSLSDSRENKRSPLSEDFFALEQRIQEGKVERLQYAPDAYLVEVVEKGAQGPPYTVGIPGRAGEQRLVRAAERTQTVLVVRNKGSRPTLGDRLFQLVPTILIVAIILFLLRSMIPGRRAKIEPAKSTVSFSDIAGVDEAVEELAEVRDFLSDPGRYERLGAKVPKGVLLYGPPGTGKTLLAKAVAKEANVPFFQVSGSEFVEMFAGLGASRVRSLFKLAKEQAPAIVFIDELDAVGRARGAGGSGAEREADQTLNQLLTEMDGFEVSEHPVVVMAASNRLDVLDKALLRPGRFDRHIAVDPPDRAGRLAVLELHARGKKLACEVSLDAIAVQTAGMTGAELANLLNEAAIIAARRHADEITAADVDAAYFRIAAGAAKQHRTLNEHERRVVAYHEAGHALVSELLRTRDRVHKISIIPRGASGGQTLYVSEDDVYLHSRSELERRLQALLGGRAAEEVVLGEVTSGAADDLRRASEMARTMVMRFGMGESFGLLSVESREQASLERLAAADAEVAALLERLYATTCELLERERPSLERIAEALLLEETLDRERFLALIERPR